TANPTRNPFFEDLQLQIEENQNEPIGPCVVIKGKSQKGYRYYTLDDWKEGGASQVNGSEEPSPAPARPARPAASAPAPAPTNVPVETVPANDAPKKRGRPRKAQAETSPDASQTSSTPQKAAPAIAPEV